MRPIVLINSQPFADIATIVVNEITYYPLRNALVEAHIDPDRPQEQIQALIVTSKHAVKALSQEMQKYPKMRAFLEIPTFAIGSGSAHALQKEGFGVEFVCHDSHGESFGNELVHRLKNRPTLYLRAKKIVSGLDERLTEAKIPFRQIIAYKNTTKTLAKSDQPAPRAIIIFTSPSNYFSFVQNFGWEGSYIAIAIGMTTFGAFGREVMGYVSPVQTIEGCVEFAKEIARIYP
ncbi:hypothetical protein BKN38_06250 [Helicobacter sp. CLO-3]|uniref:uroporphyrinogen-III synthase n=1 Tax=unclassified Helicobacter TaxID=2593540 RepID=UPI0008058158|nr:MULTISPECIES: uroporphyrinogen-III synthase [unclassified Helicobacter]OBV29932.1 hypothetical protein BA723_03670 [Helicobacter sp. CLO-3]OHU82805.1 hypothetical protein BKN38_06250 [Helicobacter sp. CLO-3]